MTNKEAAELFASLEPTKPAQILIINGDSCRAEEESLCQTDEESLEEVENPEEVDTSLPHNGLENQRYLRRNRMPHHRHRPMVN